LSVLFTDRPATWREPTCFATTELYPWYAVRVRSRYEFVTSRDLRSKGYEEFLPSYRTHHRWSDRVRDLELPLFPGYLFCRFNPRDPYRLLNSPGVVHVVSAGREYVPVNESEIAAIQSVCRSGLPVEPWPFLQVGRRILVERGPLAGTEGIVVELRGKCRLVASLTLLQRSVASEIDREWVRPVR